MGINTDQTGIQFRILNTRKGPAVRASRAQADRRMYANRMKSVVESFPLLNLKHGLVTRLLIENHRVVGVTTKEGITRNNFV